MHIAAVSGVRRAQVVAVAVCGIPPLVVSVASGHFGVECSLCLMEDEERSLNEELNKKKDVGDTQHVVRRSAVRKIKTVPKISMWKSNGFLEP